MKFSRGDFHWKPARFSSTEQEIEKICEILNNLTKQQREAARIYGRSMQEEGFDYGQSDRD